MRPDDDQAGPAGSAGPLAAQQEGADELEVGDAQAGPAREGAAEPPADDPAFERLLQFLKESRSFDFTGYKRPSLMRRVRHRMAEVGISAFEDYQDVLQLDPDEFTALFNTILINVTSFFRDPEAWEHLRTEILPVLLGASDGAPVRVWSAGCSSGQEAFSMAMMLHETMGSAFRERVKIYATDIDEEALDHARHASYTERELTGLPEEYRERYFDAVGGRFVFTPDLRRSVIFGRNDLTRDAPISRIDVLLCRNTLMYFNAETQARVVNRLGFALRPDGVLFLGKAEMLLNHTAVFEQVDLRRRFFRRVRNEVADSSGLLPGRDAGRVVVASDAAQLRDQILLTGPVAQIAVAADGRLAMVNHRASQLLGLFERDLGRPFQDLEISYRPLELRARLAEVADTQAPLWLREVEWRRSGPESTYVDIHLAPLLGVQGGVEGTSISFFDVTRFRALRVEVEATNRQLEAAYEELQSTNEELETTNEELQSTVEELETTNEELQSTNEELETMNEELQSANDELQSSNDQLRSRTSEITGLNAFMQSILSSLEGAVIVVGLDLVVQVWTSGAHDLWGLRADEAVGTSLLDLDTGLPAAELEPWLWAVTRGQERAVVGRRVEAVNRRGRTVQLRVSVTPLRGAGGGVGGALVLMEDAKARGGPA